MTSSESSGITDDRRTCCTSLVTLSWSWNEAYFDVNNEHPTPDRGSGTLEHWIGGHRCPIAVAIAGDQALDLSLS